MQQTKEEPKQPQNEIYASAIIIIEHENHPGGFHIYPSSFIASDTLLIYYHSLLLSLSITRLITVSSTLYGDPCET